MRSFSAIAAVLIAVLTVSGASARSATRAISSSCPSSVAYDFNDIQWTPARADVTGVRAPIEMRFNGIVCNGGPEPAAALAWIAIVPTGADAITQTGFIHLYDDALGTGEYCRFWAIGIGTVHVYGCGQQVNHAFVYFDIFRFRDPSTHMNFYDILDCGPADGYGNCISDNSSQVAYTTADGIVAAETDYGESACTVRIMGTAADAQKFGTSSSPIEGTLGTSSWQTRTYHGVGARCRDYGHTFKSTRMWTWDSRN